MNYASKCHLVEEKIDGIGPWLWPVEDWEGYRWPKEDWLNSHRDKWLSTVKNRKICIQAGGLCGMYPRLLSEHFEFVYTFEPDPLNFYCLANNCQKDNIIKMQAALGHKNTLVGTDTYISHNRGMTKIVDGSSIPMLTIDSLNLPACDFIQLDIEGMEAEALIGARDTILKYKPVVCIEKFWTDKTDPSLILSSYGYVEAYQSAVLDFVYIPSS